MKNIVGQSKDTERLNWLQQHSEGLRRGDADWFVVVDSIESEGEFYVRGQSVRKAVDAAMKATAKP